MTYAELYAMEKAKRGIVLPRAEGCPRNVSEASTVERAKRRYTPREGMLAKMDATIAKYRRWAAMYVQEGMSLSDIASVEGVTHQSIRRGLAKMNVPCRAKGWGHLVSMLKEQIAAKERENKMLRSRLAWARRHLAEAA